MESFVDQASHFSRNFRDSARWARCDSCSEFEWVPLLKPSLSERTSAGNQAASAVRSPRRTFGAKSDSNFAEKWDRLHLDSCLNVFKLSDLEIELFGPGPMRDFSENTESNPFHREL